MKPLKNKYTHKITLSDLTLKNAPREEFRQKLEAVNYLGYRVENLADGREIVVTKPGGKFVFGTVKREDFMVWIHDPKDESLWLISHKNIFNDLETKGNENKDQTIDLIDALAEVFKGDEPDDVLKNKKFSFQTGESPEVLLKAYKWIWGQEDCNYPTGDGREMSMEPIRELQEKLKNKSASDRQSEEVDK
jgi:hypothetical protein